jgi:RND family efflux transporter MFP subunit
MKFIKSPLFIIVIAVVIGLGIGAYAYFKVSTSQSPTSSNFFNSGTAATDGVSVQRLTLDETVNSTGEVKPVQNIDLSFQQPGQVTGVYAAVGDTVNSGKVLASLDTSNPRAQLSQAQAAVSSAQAQLQNAQAATQIQIAKLNDMKNGATAADLSLSQAQVASAAQSVQDAQTNLDNVKSQAKIVMDNQYSHSVDLINSAYSSAFDAFNSKLTGIFTNQQSVNPGLSFITTEAQAEINVKNSLPAIEASLSTWNANLNNLDSTNYPATDQALTDSLARLNNLADFLRQINVLLSNAITTPSFSADILNLDRANVNAGLSNVNAAILALNGQKQAISNQVSVNNNLITQANSQLNQAQNNLTVAQKALTLKKSGATADQIAAQAAAVSQAQAGISAQEAAIVQAQANVQNFQAQLDKYSLTAPISGVISQYNAKLGQTVSPGVPVISMISSGKFQIETDVSEADVAKIKVGNQANITLDAYGNGIVFPAVVTAIDPAQTVVNGISTYKVTLQFVKEDDRIKSGMTANVMIVTAEHKNVIAVPATEIITRGTNHFVLVDTGQATSEERPVQIGITGANNFVEITAGLNDGDKIVNFGNNQQ